MRTKVVMLVSRLYNTAFSNLRESSDFIDLADNTKAIDFFDNPTCAPSTSTTWYNDSSSWSTWTRSAYGHCVLALEAFRSPTKWRSEEPVVIYDRSSPPPKRYPPFKRYVAPFGYKYGAIRSLPLVRQPAYLNCNKCHLVFAFRNQWDLRNDPQLIPGERPFEEAEKLPKVTPASYDDLVDRACNIRSACIRHELAGWAAVTVSLAFLICLLQLRAVSVPALKQANIRFLDSPLIHPQSRRTQHLGYTSCQQALRWTRVQGHTELKTLTTLIRHSTLSNDPDAA